MLREITRYSGLTRVGAAVQWSPRIRIVSYHSPHNAGHLAV